MVHYRASVGNVEIAAISDGWLRFPVGNFFPSVPVEEWQPYSRQLDADGELAFNLGSFLLRSEGKTILVDTGLGERVPEKWDAEAGSLLKDMREKGLRPDEVDIVAITHLHIDHVGWNLIWDEGRCRPTFPNARYWIPKLD